MRTGTVGSIRPASSGKRLRRLRLEAGLTQVELAVRARVSPGTISFAERDERQPMPLVQHRVAGALGVERQEIWPDDLEAAS